MIHELTNSAWSVLASYQHDEENGLLTHEQAQSLAITRIEAIRYGADLKDYFWIQDMQPSMIMHPYRTDLNGKDLRSFSDPRGTHIFVEFANLVKREGEGYIDYVWQWNDEPDRLEPKESFVKGFEPWQWIIGTGIYIDDVHQEIARIEKSLINTSLIISGGIVLLLLFVLQQSLRIEKERQEVVDNLRDSTERYHALIEATTEGTLLVLDNQCTYANPILLKMLGYTARQLEFLELPDLLPREKYNGSVWDLIRRYDGNQLEMGKAIEGCLKASDGNLVECIISVNPILYTGQEGIILLIKDIARQPENLKFDGFAQAALAAPIGIFRARAARRGVILEINNAGKSLLSLPEESDAFQPALADIFSDPAEYEQFFQELIRRKVLKNYLIHVVGNNVNILSISVSAQLVLDENQQPSYIVGLLEDVTAERKQDNDRDALIEKLQSSLLFLHEPISNLGRNVVICSMETSIRQLSTTMTTRMVTAALVASESSTIIGIITDHDLRARVITSNLDLNLPIHTVMSAPITRIQESALIYEALLLMEEIGVSHLAVEDVNGQIVSVIDSKALIQFQSYGPVVLTREIDQAGTPSEIANCSDRIPSMVKTLLDNSARTRHVTNMLASIGDATTERLIQLAMNDLGSAPGTFAFISMGSQGRREQTLLTDQDNGIIYNVYDDGNQDIAAKYFKSLGSKICEGLNLAGYTLCQGQVMANNLSWCRSMTDWISSLNDWLLKSEPKDIMNLSILFDSRPVYGDIELAQKLRRHIHQSLIDEPAYFHHAAQNALSFKPPLRLAGNIYLSGGVSDHSNEINLKDAMMPMVSFARLYALKHQLNETHTLDRINALVERNIILPASRDEISTAYDFLMRLRLQNQLEDIQNDGRPQNTIHPAKLGHIQREMLKQAFAQITAIQKKISYDFLGGMS
jgi:PAS domain S-box-containing protein